METSPTANCATRSARSVGRTSDNLPNGFGRPIGKEELEANPLIHPESRVVSVTPFVVKPVNGFGLQLRVSDGSTLLIFPTVPDDEPEEAANPEIAVADWELASP